MTIYVLNGLVAMFCQRCGEDVYRGTRADLDLLSQIAASHRCP